MRVSESVQARANSGHVRHQEPLLLVRVSPDAHRARESPLEIDTGLHEGHLYRGVGLLGHRLVRVACTARPCAVVRVDNEAQPVGFAPPATLISSILRVSVFPDLFCNARL